MNRYNRLYLNRELSEFVDWIEEHPEEVEKFATLIGETLAGGFEALVKAGIDIDSQNVNNVTSLMYCASAGKDDLVELLLKYKAGTEFESLDGFKAIDLAVTPKIVKLLKNAKLS